ncbi:MAG: hypothetical protein ACI361_09300 [Atopobiaceae bacterium]
MDSESAQMHELVDRMHGSRGLVMASVATAAIATTALVAPVTALAEDATKAPADGAAKEAAADTKQEAQSGSYQLTQTVDQDEQNFDTKEEAQKYLDDAEEKTTELQKADSSSTYDIATTGPTQMEKQTTHEEESLVDEGSKTFDTKDAADQYVQDHTSFSDTDDTKYEASSTVTPVRTGTTVETSKNAYSGSQDGFESKEDAENWVKDQTRDYQDTDDVTYTVHADYQKSADTVPDGDPVAQKPVMTTSPNFDSKEDAEAALQKDKAQDPSTDLHKVTYSDVEQKTTVVTPETIETTTYQSDTYLTAVSRDVALAYMKAKYEKEGWTVAYQTTDTNPRIAISHDDCTKIDFSATEYRIPADSYVVVKQGTWYALWTPVQVSDETTKEILAVVNRNDPGTDGSKTAYTGNFGFDVDFWNTGTQGAGIYRVHDNGDGTYTVYASNAKISHLDHGGIHWQSGEHSFKLGLSRKVPAVTKTTYYYEKTVVDYVQPTKTVDSWKASYSVDVTSVKPVYVYKASYRVTQKKAVHDMGWKASYKITKTTEYVPSSDAEAPSTVGRAAYPIRVTARTAQSKNVLPDTGDCMPGSAGAEAIAGTAVVAMGLGLRRKDKRNEH